MKKPQILEMLGVTNSTLYRWMERHPQIATPDPETAAGHPFPRPLRKEGRELIWDQAAVMEWWDANRPVIGRHPVERPSVRMSFSRFAAIILKIEESWGERPAWVEHYDSIDWVDKDGRDAVIWFRTVNDAVTFNLSH